MHGQPKPPIYQVYSKGYFNTTASTLQALIKYQPNLIKCWWTISRCAGYLFNDKRCLDIKLRVVNCSNGRHTRLTRSRHTQRGATNKGVCMSIFCTLIVYIYMMLTSLGAIMSIIITIIYYIITENKRQNGKLHCLVVVQFNILKIIHKKVN